MSDFNFVGPAYTAPSITQDAQELICWYIEIDSTKPEGERGRYTLYPTPGLTALCTPAVGEVRGFGVSPDGASMIAIIGTGVYLVTSSYTSTLVGSVLSSSGPINITDNSGSAFWVDSGGRYYYTWATSTFGTLPATDGPWVGGFRADVADGYMLYSRQGGSQAFAATYGFGGSIDPSGVTSPNVYATKQGSGDYLAAVIVNNRLVYLIGTQSCEVWINSGATAFTFTLVPGTSTQTGTIAPYSVAGFGQPPEQTFCFIGQSDTGAGVVYRCAGFNFDRISTHAVETDIQSGVMTDAIGFSLQVGGHVWYVLTFPTQDKTWVYDDTTKQWHKWPSCDANFVYHRHRVNCTAYFNGQVVGGDYATGNIYAISRTAYTDGDFPIRRMRRSPHLVADLKQTAYESFQIQFQPGVGLSTGQGSSPQAMLRWSDDGGSTWSSDHWTSIGAQGAYKNRAIWRRLGTARDRVFEVSVSDPINAVIVSAELQAKAGAH